MFKHHGFIDPITLGLIITCLCIGGFYMLMSAEVDAPAEQAAEAILRNHGIDHDFSKDKKDAQNPKPPTAEPK